MMPQNISYASDVTSGWGGVVGRPHGRRYENRTRSGSLSHNSHRRKYRFGCCFATILGKVTDSGGAVGTVVKKIPCEPHAETVQTQCATVQNPCKHRREPVQTHADPGQIQCKHRAPLRPGAVRWSQPWRGIEKPVGHGTL